jgi:tetratricopeptide (TPR) repeat protein
MEKLWIFSLSLFLGWIAVGCQAQPTGGYEQLDPEQRERLAQIYDAQFPRWYQGAAYRQQKFDTLLAMAPWVESYWRQKSITHTKIGDYHLAFPLLEKAAELDPEEALYYYSWLLLFYYRDYERALHYLNEYDNLHPGQMQYAWGENVNYQKGLAHKGLGDFKSAIREFSTAIEQEGRERTDVYTFVYRGICYLKLERYEEAIQDFEECLAQYDRCAMAHTYRAIAHYGLGDFTNAQEDLQVARELIERGYKKEDPYIHVFNEVYPLLIEDLETSMQAGQDVLHLIE